MKRFFILATAAIVALASCAKTEVVYNDAPEQIAFKQITGAMTKAFTTDTDLGVFAYQDGGKHFDNLPFAHNGTAWTNASAFWPYSGNLTFTVYAPYVDGKAALSGKVLTLTGVSAAEDLYYGEEQVTTAKVNTVPVYLKHLSAKVTVNVNLGTYTLTSLTLDDACTNGDVTVDYTATPAAVAVTTATLEQSLDVKTTNTQYVLPGEQTSFTISFKQGDLSFTKPLDLGGTWVANTAYTYNITIANPEQIYINATVREWDTDLNHNDDLTDDANPVPVV